MKHNWEYKTLCEVCKLSAGGDKPAETSKEKTLTNMIPVYSNGIENDGLYGYCSKAKVFNNALTISGRGTIGYPSIKREPFVPIIRLIVAEPNDNIKLDYLYYWVYNRRFSGNGAAIPQLTVPMIKNEIIPVPSMEVQEQIVAELDKINEIISDCKEAIRNLDILAQSLFYDFFGDPITNPNGWEITNLNEICESISTGITYKPDNVVENGTIVLRSSNIQDSQLVLDDIVCVDRQFKLSQYVRNNDILMCSRNGSSRLVGKVALIPNHKEEMSWGAFMTIIRSKYYHFLFQFFRLPAFREQLTKTKTTTVNQITIGMLKGIKLPVPPMELQKEFVTRIEQIDQQKQGFVETIANMQTLLDSRMDYWFG